MNDRDESKSDPLDEPILEELFASLRRLEPPLEARIANRLAVAAELSVVRNANRQRALPWWRRSISVPLPLAASLLVLAALVVPMRLAQWNERSSTQPEAPNSSANQAAGTHETTSAGKRMPGDHPKLSYYQTETYVCGIGPVNSESRYFIQE